MFLQQILASKTPWSYNLFQNREHYNQSSNIFFLWNAYNIVSFFRVFKSNSFNSFLIQCKISVIHFISPLYFELIASPSSIALNVSNNLLPVLSFMFYFIYIITAPFITPVVFICIELIHCLCFLYNKSFTINFCRRRLSTSTVYLYNDRGLKQ